MSRRTRWAGRLLAAWVVIAIAAPAAAVDMAEELQAQIDELRSLYEARIAALEARVAELEGTEGKGEPPQAVAAATDLESIRAAAAAALASTGTVAEASPPPIGPATGRERNLSVFNPEISFTGDLLAFGGDGSTDVDLREVELDLQSTLDPFSSTKVTLAISSEGVEVEEGYIRYAGLARGLTLRAGQMRQSFGVLNRWHLHALPQVDYPLVLTTFFDDEGLAQAGLSAEWLLPRPWASANELVVQVTDGSSSPFGGESFESLVGLAHLKSYWDLSPSTYLEWGVSAALGEPEPGRRSRVWGTDLTVSWQPPSRARYRELTWRTEILLSQRDLADRTKVDAWGGYTYLEGLVRQNLYLGLRGDWVEDPELDLPGADVYRVTPYLSWWQSEFVRLRAALELERDRLGDEDHSRFLLQLTWAAGPHKHDTY